MQDKKLRNSNMGMNKYEKQYNKPLLKVLNDKRKPEMDEWSQNAGVAPR